MRRYTEQDVEVAAEILYSKASARRHIEYVPWVELHHRNKNYWRREADELLASLPTFHSGIGLEHPQRVP